jgi:hypothetical protein
MTSSNCDAGVDNWRNAPHPDLGGALRATGRQSREGVRGKTYNERHRRPDLDGQTARATTICQGRGGGSGEPSRGPATARENRSAGRDARYESASRRRTQRKTAVNV